MVVDRKFSQFTLENGASIVGTDFFAGYRSGVDNIRFQINSLAEYFNANLNFVNEGSSATLNGLVVFSDTSGKNISGLPFSPIASSLIGYLNSGDLGNIKIGANLVIDDDGFLNAEGGGGGGNVFANGSGTTTNIPVYTTDGFTIGSSSIFDDGTNVSTDEPINAQAFNAIGSGNILGQGTISVENGSPAVNGSGTLFFTELGFNSAINILGEVYSVSRVISDTLVILTAPYDAADDSGLPFTLDAPFISFTGSNGTPLAHFSNYGALIYDSITSISYKPSIIPISFGGTTSGLAIDADTLFFNIDSAGSYQVLVNNSAIFTVLGNGTGIFAGDLTSGGDLHVGVGATAGQSIILQTSTYDTYLPTLTSSNDGSHSNLAFLADSFFFNMESGQNFEVDGNILTASLTSENAITSRSTVAPQSIVLDIDGDDLPLITFGNSGTLQFDGSNFNFSNPITGPSGAFSSAHIDGQLTVEGGFRNDLGTSDTYYVLGDSGAYGLVMYGNNPVYNYTAIDTFFYGLPDDGYPVAFSIGGAGVQLSKYQVNTLNNTLDDGINGTAHFGGNLGVGTPASNDYRVIADGALAMNNVFDIPPTNNGGGVFYVEFDSDLGVSLPFFKDSNGSVTQLGAGSGGSGTVTEVDTTTDLTVDGTPGGAFTVSGTIGLANTAVTAASYDFAHITVDAKGRLTAAAQRGFYDSGNSNLFVNGVGTTGQTGITNGTIFGAGADASDSSIANFTAIGYNSQAGNQGVSVGTGAGSNFTGHDEHLFLGYGADATTGGLLNVAAIGTNAKVTANNSFSYGDGSISHGFGVTTPDDTSATPQSTMHIKSNATSGSLGSKGVFRLNGINDAGHTWPVTDQVTEQHAIISTGATTTTILSLPISNAQGGCITEAEIKVSGIINNGTASGTGKINVRGAFDGTNTFYINNVSTTTPVLITLDPGTTAPFALPSGTASAQVVLSGTTGPGSQNLLVQVVGINATTINWTAWATYSTTQANAN